MQADDHVPLSVAQSRLAEMVDLVRRENDRVVITRHGKAAAVFISPDELSSLEETLDIMSRPHLIGQVRQNLEELALRGAEVLDKADVTVG